MWDDLKNTLADIAPTLATALGGSLAGGAVGLIEGALGLDNATADQIKHAVSHADPATLIKIKQADQAFALELQKLSAGDKANARAMQIATKSKTPATLAFTTLLSFFAICILIFILLFRGGFGQTAILTQISMIIGYMSAKVTMVMGYYFGGSEVDQSMRK